jgi:pimeloyl-ACP methyl ester carboxylesterase
VGVEVSEELFAPVSDAITLCYQTFGSPGDDPLLLVMGLAGPMTWWDDDFCTSLAEAGFFVIRFDNRDSGRSSRVEGRVGRLRLVGGFLGLARLAGNPPYTMTDLASDGFGLLDHLGLAKAHILGMSMGGMIVQTMAIEHPERVLSLTSIMSTTGSKRVGYQHPVLYPTLLAGSKGRDGYIKSNLATWKLIGSPGYPHDDDKLRARAGETYDRGVSKSGILRQMTAVLEQPNRTGALAGLTMPALVMHGKADRMVNVSGGRATAKAIPGAELILFDGMGHDLPQPLWPRYVAAIRTNADRA